MTRRGQYRAAHPDRRILPPTMRFDTLRRDQKNEATPVQVQDGPTIGEFDVRRTVPRDTRRGVIVLLIDRIGLVTVDDGG